MKQPTEETSNHWQQIFEDLQTVYVHPEADAFIINEGEEHDEQLVRSKAN